MENYFNNYTKTTGYFINRDNIRPKQDNVQNPINIRKPDDLQNMPPTFTEGDDEVSIWHTSHETYNALGGNDILLVLDSQNNSYYGGKGDDWLTTALWGDPYHSSNWNFFDGGEGDDAIHLGALQKNSDDKRHTGNFASGGAGDDKMSGWYHDYVELSGDEGNDLIEFSASDNFKAFGGQGNDTIVYAERKDFYGYDPEHLNFKSGGGYISGGSDNDIFKVENLPHFIDECTGEVDPGKFKLNEKGNIVMLYNGKETEIEKDIETISFGKYSLDLPSDKKYSYSGLVKIIKDNSDKRRKDQKRC